MSNTVVKKTKTVDSGNPSKTSLTKIENDDNLNVLAKKTARMKAILVQFPLPAENC